MDTEDFAYVCMCYGPGELADLEYLSSCQFGVRTKMPESIWSLDLLICNTTSIPFIPTEDTTEFSCLYQAGFNREFIFTGRTRKLNHKSPLSDCLHECGCAALRIEERRFGSDPSRDLSIFLHSRAVKGG